MITLSLQLRSPGKSTVALSLALVLALGAAVTASAATLTVTFTGLKTQAGAVMMSLTGSPEAWDGKAAPTDQRKIPADAATVTATFTNLKPGSYAVRAFHDIDGDGRLNVNPFGMPTEPYAFSNNAHGSMGPAAWGDAVFVVTDGDNRQTIDIE